MRVAIVQSCYLPWKGYFDLIRSSDHFILLDSVQYSRGDWRNRNQIKTAAGLKWLTIPLRHSGTFPAAICDMRVSAPDWSASHYSTIQQAYRASPGWPVLRDWMEGFLLRAKAERLTEVNEFLLRSLCALLGIRTPMTQSVVHGVQSTNPTERVVQLCQAVGATHYLSGPRAREYMEEHRFEEAGIRLEYFDYSGYPEYQQPHGPFEHHVSIVDTIACLGADAASALKKRESSACLQP